MTIYVTDVVTSLPPRLQTCYKAIYAQEDHESTMITDIITVIHSGIRVYRWEELRIVEQRSQIVLQLGTGSISNPE